MDVFISMVFCLLYMMCIFDKILNHYVLSPSCSTSTFGFCSLQNIISIYIKYVWSYSRYTYLSIYVDRRFVVWQVMLYNQGKIKVYFWGISTLGHFQSKKCKKIIFTLSAGYIRKPRNINIYFCGQFWWFCKLVR